MPGNDRNIYQTARLAAGFSQEQAAELLGASVESLRAYETGQRVPPAVRVAEMEAVYHAPGLRLQHAAATDELGIIPKAVRVRSLEQATLRLMRIVRDMLTHLQRLMEIAEDGVIDETEVDDFDRIEDFISAVVAACLEVQHCEKGAKKERPDVGASKRSSSPEMSKPENHCAAIISGFPRERKGIFAGGEVTSL